MDGFLNRRTLMSAGAAAGAALVSSAVSSRSKAAASPFTLGVASGSPWPDGFVIWTRLAPDPVAMDGQGGLIDAVDVVWEVSTDEVMGVIVARGQARADAASAHAVHVEVAGLRPGRPYWYRFTAQGEQSPVGRARTAPARGAPLSHLRLAIASCAHWETGWFSAYRHMAAEDPDLVFFLGDYIYEYGYAASRTDVVRRFDRPEECRTLADYRRRYALYRTDPDLQSLHATAPCLVTWDDHEVQNDYSADFSQIGTIPTAEFRTRRLAAYKAFYEHMPLRRSVVANLPEFRIYSRFDYGDLAQISVLDGRQYRSIQPCAVGNSRRGHVAPLTCTELHDPARSMLGQAQERWLYEGFRASRARWNLIAQDLLVAPMAQADSSGRPGAFTEGWSGYEMNRTRMLNAVASSRLRNPVFFGGDMHASFTTDLKANFDKPDSRTIATEFIGAAVTSDPAGDSVAAAMPANPHIRYFDNRHHGYMSVNLTPGRMETRHRAVSDRRDPQATVSTVKAFAVEAGRPGAQDA